MNRRSLRALLIVLIFFGVLIFQGQRDPTSDALSHDPRGAVVTEELGDGGEETDTSQHHEDTRDARTDIPVVGDIAIPAISIAGWGTYRCEALGFELQYPPSWHVEDTSAGNIRGCGTITKTHKGGSNDIPYFFELALSSSLTNYIGDPFVSIAWMANGWALLDRFERSSLFVRYEQVRINGRSFVRLVRQFEDTTEPFYDYFTEIEGRVYWVSGSFEEASTEAERILSTIVPLR